MAFINLNSKLIEQQQPALQADNRSFRYGYGLFETILVKDGEIRLKKYHWQRLWQGMEQLHFTLPKHFTPSVLEAEVLRTVRKNKLEGLCRVRLQVFPGDGGLYDGANYNPHYLVETFPLEPHIMALNETGLTVGIARGLVKSNDSVANIKSCNALVYALASRQAKENKWNDTLIVNNSGHIIETSIANLFWVEKGKIYTPPLSEGCIAGVMRAYILDKAAEKGLEIALKPLTVAELMDADEIFATNAIRRLKWVGNIDDTVYKCDQIKRICSIIF